MREDARITAIAWFGLTACAIAGYGTIVAPAERQIVSLSSEAQNLHQLAARNERMLLQSTAIARARERVRSDLAELRTENGTAKAMLELLRFLDDASKRQNVTFGGIVPMERANAGSGLVRISITLSGAYADVLRVVAELTTRRTVVGVDSVHIARASTAAGDGNELTATVAATLYYGAASFTHASEGEDIAHARTVER